MGVQLRASQIWQVIYDDAIALCTFFGFSHGLIATGGEGESVVVNAEAGKGDMRDRKASRWHLWAVVPIVILIVDVSAHAAQNLPGNADPGRFFENLKSVPEPKIVQPQTNAVPRTVEPVLPSGSDNAFLVRKVVFEGVKVYPVQELEALFQVHFRTHSATLRTLFKTVQSVEQKYHQDGYVLAKAFLPPQDISDGVVTVRVDEGYVASVEVQGGYRPGRVANAIMERIHDMVAFRVSDLERNTLLLGDATGLPVHAVLQPNGATDGGIGVALVFDDKAAAGNVSVDNQGTRYSGPAQYGFSATAFNRVFTEQQATLSGFVTSPVNNLKYISMAERIALDADGDALTISGSYAHTQPGFRLKPEDIAGDSFNYGVSFSRPVIRSRVENLSFTGDLTAKDVVTDALHQRLYADRLRIASILAHFDIQDGWQGANLAEVKLSQGLDLPGVTPTGTPHLSRANGYSDFTRITGNLSRLQQINEDVRLYVAGEGQYAWSPLLSSEQFGFGGQQFGRAFDSSELTGDDGIAGTVELRFMVPNDGWKLSLEPFTFFDAGRVWNFADDKPIRAFSTGVGIRYSYGNSGSGAFTIAKPLDYVVAAPTYGNGKNLRLFFSLNLAF